MASKKAVAEVWVVERRILELDIWWPSTASYIDRRFDDEESAQGCLDDFLRESGESPYDYRVSKYVRQGGKG